MGLFARLTGIFTSPTAVFQELKGRPTWLVPLLIVSVAIAVMNASVSWSPVGERAIREEIQKKAPNVPPEALDRQLTITRNFGPVGALVGFPIFTMLIAGLLYLIFSVGMGGEGTFKQTLSAYAHTSVIGVAGGLVGTVLIFLKGNLRSSTALSAFLPFLEESSFLYKVFQGFDVFLLWQLGVLSVGMGVIQQTGTRKAAIAIFSVFVTIVLILAGIRQAMQ
jgi:hypothetical protein